MRALIFLVVLSKATARGGRGGGRGSSSRGSSRGSSFRGSGGSRSRPSSPSYRWNNGRLYQTSQKELDRQKLAESYAYGGENWGKLSHSKPKVPVVVPVVLTDSSHSHFNENSFMSKYVFGTSSFSVSSVWRLVSRVQAQVIDVVSDRIGF